MGAYLGFFALILIAVSWLAYEWVRLGKVQERAHDRERLMRELRRKKNE